MRHCRHSVMCYCTCMTGWNTAWYFCYMIKSALNIVLIFTKIKVLAPSALVLGCHYNRTVQALHA